MSSRTFTVFQDTLPSEAPRSRAPSISSVTSPLSLKPVNSNQATTLTTTEKENLNPLTGERAGSTNNTKKRKTSVLAAKVHVPLGSKKQKESKESMPDAKKRKSSSTSVARGKVGIKKDGKLSSVSRKGTKKPSRKVSPMPKVEEEADKERERTTQAEIDSRCYELTVQPLADLSQAYEQSSSLETLDGGEKDKFRPVKASSVEPEIRDYFSSPPQSAALPSGSSTSSVLSVEGRSFSTPERKQIYTTFTFTSPSPTSERFSKTFRNGNIPHLELV